MKAFLIMDFDFDGTPPPKEIIENAVLSLVKGMLLSEEFDGSEDWALLVNSSILERIEEDR